MAKISKTAKFFIYFAIFVVLVVILSNELGKWLITPKTIAELIKENKYLKQAITNLTQEDQMGYAKVIKSDVNNGRLFTTVLFVETARNDKDKKILEKSYRG